MCICDIDRFSNCFSFNYTMNNDCQGYNYCENDGQCFLNRKLVQLNQLVYVKVIIMVQNVNFQQKVFFFLLMLFLVIILNQKFHLIDNQQLLK
jgi:hypothetical protein